MSILGLISARGGSKGIPYKNIKPLNGKPLIAYTIEQARESKCLTRLIVSTDDENIADMAKEYGAEVPFMRPNELAQDHTPGIDVVLHAIDWLNTNEGYCPDAIMLLQPTSPFRMAADIDNAVAIYNERNPLSLVSVCIADDNPYWMMSINDGILTPLFGHIDHTRRQDLPKAYKLNGAIYISSPAVLKERRTFFTENTMPYIMPRERSMDIDDMLDFHIAEYLLKEGIIQC
jgi:CMP-N-acetylneuraminic acid synthetase